MDGEALNRKYWELRGWRFFNVLHKNNGPVDEEWTRTYCHKPGCRWFDNDNAWDCVAPPLHLDANLAIAEANRQVRPRHYWEVKFFGEVASAAMKESGSEIILVHAQADGPRAFCEAILKALIAALEVKNGLADL